MTISPYKHRDPFLSRSAYKSDDKKIPISSDNSANKENGGQSTNKVIAALLPLALHTPKKPDETEDIKDEIIKS